MLMIQIDFVQVITRTHMLCFRFCVYTKIGGILQYFTFLLISISFQQGTRSIGILRIGALWIFGIKFGIDLLRSWSAP